MINKLKEIISKKTNFRITFSLVSGQKHIYESFENYIDIRETYLSFINNGNNVIISIEKIESIEINQL